MSDKEALLAAIGLHPDEDTPRLAYADWLDEHGDASRARFIRAQCELATLPGVSSRARELRRTIDALLGTHYDTWLAEAFPRLSPEAIKEIDPVFERGFPTKLRIDDVNAQAVTDHAQALFATNDKATPPIDEIEIFNARGLLPHLASQERFPAIRRLKLDTLFEEEDLVPDVPGQSYVNNDEANHADLLVIARSPKFAALRDLLVSFADEGGGLEDMLASPNLSSLSKLTFKNTGFFGGQNTTLMDHIVMSPSLQSLRELHFEQGNFGFLHEHDLDRLEAWPGLSRLNALTLAVPVLNAPDQTLPIYATRLKSLLDKMPNLQELGLAVGHLAPGAIDYLQKLPPATLPNLQHLKLVLDTTDDRWPLAAFTNMPCMGKVGRLTLATREHANRANRHQALQGIPAPVGKSFLTSVLYANVYRFDIQPDLTDRYGAEELRRDVERRNDGHQLS